MAGPAPEWHRSQIMDLKMSLQAGSEFGREPQHEAYGWGPLFHSLLLAPCVAAHSCWQLALGTTRARTSSGWGGLSVVLPLSLAFSLGEAGPGPKPQGQSCPSKIRGGRRRHTSSWARQGRERQGRTQSRKAAVAHQTSKVAFTATSKRERQGGLAGEALSRGACAWQDKWPRRHLAVTPVSFLA
jgi:hypothetical protein